MKKQLILMLTGGILALPLKAQTTNNDTPSPRLEHGPMAGLTKEEKDQMKAAHDKAVAQDPTLEQKMEAAHKAMYDAMVAVDPSVAPILDKMKSRRMGVVGGNPDRKWNKRENGQTGDPRHGPPGMTNLSESERAQLKALHGQVKSDPAVMAAHDAVKSAATPETRRAAEEALRQAMHDAMIKVDPTIGPILEKLHPGSGQQVQPSPDATPAMQ